MANIDESLVDKRVVERNIRKGKLTKKDHEQYLGGLRDVEANAEIFTVGIPGADDDDEDEA